MADKKQSVWSLVLVFAVISLAVSILRLIGELKGWSGALFNATAPGAKDQQIGLVGIGWLIPIFGFYLGRRLRSSGNEVALGKATLRFAIGGVVMIGGFFVLSKLGLITMPDEKAPAEPSGLPYALTLVFVSVVVMITAWPRLATALLVYGLLARIPVLVITYMGLQQGWNIHYTKLPPGMLVPAGSSTFTLLAMPQMTFWIVVTMLFGGLFGCLGAGLARRAK